MRVFSTFVRLHIGSEAPHGFEDHLPHEGKDDREDDDGCHEEDKEGGKRHVRTRAHDLPRHREDEGGEGLAGPCRTGPSGR